MNPQKLTIEKNQITTECVFSRRFQRRIFATQPSLSFDRLLSVVLEVQREHEEDAGAARAGQACLDKVLHAGERGLLNYLQFRQRPPNGRPLAMQT